MKVSCLIFILSIVLFFSCSSPVGKSDNNNVDSDTTSDNDNGKDPLPVNDDSVEDNDNGNDNDSEGSDSNSNEEVDSDETDNDETNIVDNDPEIVPICEPGEQKCSDNEKIVYKCTDDGLDWDYEICETDYYCNNQSFECEPLYVISIDNGNTHTRLLKIDVTTGEGVEICRAEKVFGYNSSTFTRESILYISRSGNLDRMEPNTCEIEHVGVTGYKAVPGITSNYDDGIYGVANRNNDEGLKNHFIDLDIITGVGTKIGDLGHDFGTCGATWAEELQSVYSINGSTNKLYLIDRNTGAAEPIKDLIDENGDPFNFGSVGIEMHPLNGKIYACSSSMPNHELLEIDPETGVVKVVGEGMGHENSCNNLGAPWKNVLHQQ
jgi:hypothetical protein